MSKKRRGRQKPTVWFTLPYRKSLGKEAVELYNSTGRTAQGWQENLIKPMMAVNKDGLWVHSRYGYSVPRQNGKNEVIAMREQWGLRHGERILHTAHRTSTSRAAWERLILLLEANGITEKSAANPDGYTSGKSKGQEFIFLSEKDGGGRIQFRTRTTTGGLGESFDLLVIDEAQEYQDDQESALKYTIAASENPQTILLGTPPTPQSSGTIFPDFRKQVLCGEKKNAGWAEWSIEDEVDPHDMESWYNTNPSLGYKLTERTIEDEIGTDPIDFNIQRLGLWIRYNQKSAISKREWENLGMTVLPQLVGYLAVGVKFNRDGGNVSLAIAALTDDDKVFVEAIGCRPVRDGYDWITTFLASLNGNYSKVIVDGANGQSVLSEAMKDARLKPPVVPSTGEYIEANAKFEQRVFQKKLCHMLQPAVGQVVTNCEKRSIGSAGGFGYKSVKIGADISILDAIILAAWGAEQFKGRKKVQRISY